MKRIQLLPVAVALLGVSACAPPPEVTGATASAIIGGDVDTSDPAVVLIFAQSTTTATTCSGTVIAPHVVLTAAHCVDPAVLTGELGATYELLVFSGDDVHGPQGSDPSRRFEVASSAFDPAWPGPPPGAPAVGPPHDIGVVVTTTALSVAPVALNRASLAASVGQPARLVGFGNTVADDPNSYGVRYAADQVVSAVDEVHLFYEGPPGICGGDSGGPSLIDRAGVTSIAGVHSWVEHATSCTGRSQDIIIDEAAQAFLAPQIEMADPGFMPPADGSDGAGGGGGGGGGGGPSSGAGGSGGPAGGAGQGARGGGGSTSEAAPSEQSDSGCSVRSRRASGGLEVAALAIVACAALRRRRRVSRRRRRRTK